MSRIIRQATCVALPLAGGPNVNGADSRRALLIEGPPGSGKSSLALALIDRGAMLVGDDGVTLEPRGEAGLWASPPPNIVGKLEIRNVGIVDLPTAQAPVALILRLDAEAPRHVEAAEVEWIADRPVPLIRLWPGSPALALRAEWALALYGRG